MKAPSHRKHSLFLLARILVLSQTARLSIIFYICIYFLCRVRIPAKHVYYYRCPDHRKNYVMSFSFCFDKEDDIYQFAYCYPYSYTRLQNYLDNLEKKNMDFFSRELLCLTVVCISLYFYYSVKRAIPIPETIFNLLAQMPCKL